MKRKKFLQVAGAMVCLTAAGAYTISDKSNFVRSDLKTATPGKFIFQKDEEQILYLASLAPSGHNTQPWFVKYIAPYHWIICNDKSRWLPGVDETQRETILSIGAFLQNLEYAAGSFGYDCNSAIIATNNQDEQVVEIKLIKVSNAPMFDIEQIKLRRTVRSNYQDTPLAVNDFRYLAEKEEEFIHLIAQSTQRYSWLNEQTIEANRIQSCRDNAQMELANWIRFSSEAAEKYCDGLTTAGMEIQGIPGWVLRNFYKKADVLEKSFREQTIDKVKEQVQNSGGWLLISSKDNSVVSLIETGKRLQRLLLKIRNKNIAIHPMTQVLEEPAIAKTVNQSIGINAPVQFVLRAGYIKNYPQPVSLRRPVEWFVRSVS